MVHGCLVYKERTETAAVSCSTSHASTVSTRLRSIFKNALKNKTRKWLTHVETYEPSDSARERRIALYKSDHHHHHHHHHHHYHCLWCCQWVARERLAYSSAINGLAGNAWTLRDLMLSLIVRERVMVWCFQWTARERFRVSDATNEGQGNAS